MTQGATRADAPQDGGEDRIYETAADDWTVVPMSEDYSGTEQWHVEGEPTRSLGTRIMGVLLVLLAVAWIAGIAWLAWQDRAALTVQSAPNWIALACPPLILLGLVWLIFGRSSRRETQRFSRSVAALRGETAALEGLLGVVATRLEDNHNRLTEEAAKLMSLGDEAADRLGRVAHYLAKESANLDRKSDALESAAAAARVDIGVLLTDLPRAEEQARAVAEAMKQAGLGAHEHTGALESQLSALVARGREADEIVGGAAQRLAAHIARIESTTETAATRMDEATGGMTAAVDASMARAAEAVDAARVGLEAQGTAMLAMIEQSRAALDRAGDEAGRSLAHKLDTIGTKIEGLAEHLSAQDAASTALVSGLSRDLAELDQQFIQLSETGIGNTEKLEAMIEQARQRVGQLSADLGQGTDRAGDLIGRAHQMAEALASVVQQLDQGLPAGLARAEAQAGQTQAATATALADIEALQRAAEVAKATIGDAEASLGRQREGVDQLIASLSQSISGAEEQLRGLTAITKQADSDARRLVSETAPDLVASLLQVRETAQQAAERAREAIAEVIPQSASALAEASRSALTETVNNAVTEQLALLTELAERAVGAARRASDRLTRQMLTIGKTTAAIETRMDESERAREDAESHALTRRVALLMESLNSTAIDVTKILSNEVTDTAWTAYLKGDRGIFTRRAVRLLTSGEARAIAQHYEADPEFREQVNRYIHDFEAMLRRILNERDGSVLGVTLLSSDMGKLYVALAQAIERLR
jgi:hypothetical protein